jgi:putative chitinase
MATILAPQKINRANFYKLVKSFFFNGKLAQSQVDGIEIIFSEWESRNLQDLRWLSYMLATVMHETAKTFQPIAEYGKGKGKKYGLPVNGHIYYGRGFVQLTWPDNYKTMGEHIGVDLYNNPDLAMDCKVATDILFEGMIKGMFTGKKLADYFNAAKEDWVNARRIINILDQASLIASYGKKFYTALI